MTMQAVDGTPGDAGLPPADSFTLARAEDGDVLLVMQGSWLDPERDVAVHVTAGVLSVAQADAGGRPRVVVRAPLDAEGRAMLEPLPELQIVEIYLGDTEDETRMERHHARRVRLRYEGRARHG